MTSVGLLKSYRKVRAGAPKLAYGSKSISIITCLKHALKLFCGPAAGKNEPFGFERLSKFQIQQLRFFRSRRWERNKCVRIIIEQPSAFKSRSVFGDDFWGKTRHFASVPYNRWKSQ